MRGQDDLVPAWKISEMLLDKTGVALDAGDFDTFMSAFVLPYTHATFEGVIELTEAAEMRLIFDRVRYHFRQSGVTRIIRMCVAAEYDGPNRINATHESHMFTGNQRIRQPYPVLSQLERTDAGWQIRSSNYAVAEDAGHAAALMPDRVPFAKRPSTTD